MSQKFKISIIEDDKFYRNLISWKLQQNQYYTIKTYSTGEEYLSDQNAESDVMIIDYHLNGKKEFAMNGLEFAKLNSNIPKIFITSEEDFPTALRTFVKGKGMDYIHKGYASISKIENGIAEILETGEDSKNLNLLREKNKKAFINKSRAKWSEN